jgi:hypothetical protein
MWIRRRTFPLHSFASSRTGNSQNQFSGGTERRNDECIAKAVWGIPALRTRSAALPRVPAKTNFDRGRSGQISRQGIVQLDRD